MNSQTSVTKEEKKEIKELIDSIFEINSSPKKIERETKKWGYGVLRQTLKDLKKFKNSLS